MADDLGRMVVGGGKPDGGGGGVGGYGDDSWVVVDNRWVGSAGGGGGVGTILVRKGRRAGVEREGQRSGEVAAGHGAVVEADGGEMCIEEEEDRVGC
jgi:hypothetical protein